MSLFWGIYPPKFASNEVYYKDLITFCVEDGAIIGAKQWDYNGKARVTSYIDLPYSERLATYKSNVVDVDTSVLISDVSRITWLFNSEDEAIIQKIWCLKKIKDYFYNNRDEEKKIFDTKIPETIEKSFNKIKNKNPEYFL
ncbi:MAG: hypothetical protein J7L15_00015 [Clostridiales bacterium]|nr:hypothetical protein [Clostridiales bacterium]